MNVTPLDLRQQQFRTVDARLRQRRGDRVPGRGGRRLRRGLREADRLRQDVTRLEGLVNEHREHERNLRNTLLTAQRLADEISDNAHKQAATIIKDAESRASLILEKAQAALRGRAARDRRPPPQAARGRELGRVHDRDPEEHARVRPRAGRPRPRREDPAPPARASTDSRESRCPGRSRGPQATTARVVIEPRAG